MYAVVGCSDCGSLWVVEGRPDRTKCRTCGTSHRFDTLKQFVTTEDPDAAREARAAMLADRRGEADAFADLDSFAELEDHLADAGVDDETFLAESGLDPAAVAEAGERATEGPAGGQSRRETVLEGLATLEDPTAEDVVAYADERGVPGEYVREALDRLARSGRVTEDDGTYRLL